MFRQNAQTRQYAPITLTLTSTIVSPFAFVYTQICPLTAAQFRSLCKIVGKNYCGHPVTLQHLASAGIELPATTKDGFWDMKGIAIAARPKGGVRGAAEVEVDALDQLEFVAYVHLNQEGEADEQTLEAFQRLVAALVEAAESGDMSHAFWYDGVMCYNEF